MTLFIVTEPSVYLVGRSSVDDAELGRFLADLGVAAWETDTEVGGEKLIETAGRLCYQSFAKPRPGGNAAYIGHILEVGHGSVLEHSVFNLVIAGVSRSFTHELVRHRAGFGFSQLSQRFVDESSCEFVVPPALFDEVMAAKEYVRRVVGRPGALASDVSGDMTNMNRPTPEERAGLDWLIGVETCQDVYGRLSSYLYRRNAGIPDTTARRKAAREASRSVLPNATETKIFVTANGRALRHFIEMRADPAADAEMRRVAVAVLEAVRADSPNLFADFAVDGDRATCKHHKV